MRNLTKLAGKLNRERSAKVPLLIIALVAIIGFSVAACGGEDDPGTGTTYAVTVNGGTGSGNYAQGATVTITANTPPSGQQFKNWTTASAGVTFANANGASTTFTMPGNAVTVTANFEPISPGGGGTTYAVTVTNGTGSGNYAQGATVAITANTPPAGQQFKNWTTTSAGVTFANANSASTTFTMPGNAVAVWANFEAISPGGGGTSMNDAIPLTENQWSDLFILLTSSDVQWFRFIATSSTQYIHVDLGTLIGLYVQVYNSGGTEVENEERLYGFNPSASRSLEMGQTYYIRVKGYGNSGTYRIGFTASDTAPPVQLPSSASSLTANQWADRALTTSSSQQWFRFTTTSSTQWIHIETGTLTNLYVNVYDSGGTEVGSVTFLVGSNTRTSRMLTEGQTYYIRVKGNSGTYRIAFGAIAPPGHITLTENKWVDGYLPNDGEQWFRFTANATTQYIHASFVGTLTELYVNVYNSRGSEVGSETRLYESTTNTTRTLTAGQIYYIRMRGNSETYYRIGFNTSTTAPPPDQLSSSAIQLTENQWADGNIPTPSSAQWFTFTASAATQYIHAASGTLGALYVQVYNSGGTAVGSETGLYNSTTPTTRTLTAGQTYYIRVRSYLSGYSGTYWIAFNTTSTAPATP